MVRVAVFEKHEGRGEVEVGRWGLIFDEPRTFSKRNFDISVLVYF